MFFQFPYVDATSVIMSCYIALALFQVAHATSGQSFISATNMAESSIEALSDGTPHRPVPRQASRADGAEGDESAFMVDVSEALPSNDAIQSFLASPECGAISTFVGITRNNFDGKVGHPSELRGVQTYGHQGAHIALQGCETQVRHGGQA
ncbi:hypothetical protein THAOC_18903, partial [Thalassiosira oceanica]